MSYSAATGKSQGETMDQPAEISSGEHKRMSVKRITVMVLQVLGVVALFAITRLPSIPHYPINIDESIYSAVAVRCSHLSELPYVAAVDNKGPLTHWTYQATFLFFGDYNVPAVHVIGAIIVALNTAMVWHIGWRCFGAVAGPPAAMLYLLGMANAQDCLAFNAELPASLPLLIAAWLVLTARHPLGALRCLLVGLLVTTAAGYRQNCLIAYPVACLGVLALSYVADRRVWPAIGRAVLVGLGGLVPVAVVVGVYAGHHALPALYAGYYEYNAKYYMAAVQMTPWRLLIAAWHYSGWLNDTALITMLSAMGLVAIFWKIGVSRGGRGDPPEFFVPRAAGLYLAALTIALWWGTTIGWRFYPHYRMIEWPFSAVLAAGGWMLLRGQLRQRHTRIVFKVAATVVLVALGFRASSSMYLAAAIAPPSTDIAPCAREAALRLKAVTRPEESIFVWGDQPAIYLVAHRRMATRYPRCTGQVGLIPFENYLPRERDRSAWVIPGSFAQMMSDLRSDPPAYVVDASQDERFLNGLYPIERFSELHQWLQANYVEDFRVPAPEGNVLVVYRQADRSPTDLAIDLQWSGHPLRPTATRPAEAPGRAPQEANQVQSVP